MGFHGNVGESIIEIDCFSDKNIPQSFDQSPPLPLPKISEMAYKIGYSMIDRRYVIKNKDLYYQFPVLARFEEFRRNLP